MGGIWRGTEGGRSEDIRTEDGRTEDGRTAGGWKFLCLSFDMITQIAIQKIPHKGDPKSPGVCCL